MSDDLDWREKRKEDKEEEEVGRRHKHKKHHKKKGRKRSGSKERKRSRSREKEERRKRGEDRDRERHRQRRRSRSRSRSRSRGEKGSEKRDRDRSDRPGKEREKRVPPTGPNSSDSDEDFTNTVQPFSTTAVPEAGSKLKAEIERRKQLLGKKVSPEESPSTSSASIWKKTAFSNDNDGKVSAKFKRLMGIKEVGAAPSSEGPSSAPPEGEGNRQEYFENLEKQYEVARAQTHQQRGLGLGFSSRL